MARLQYKSEYVTITDRSRGTYGASPAFEKAVNKLFEVYNEALRIHPLGRGTKFHVILAIQRPEDDPLEITREVKELA